MHFEQASIEAIALDEPVDAVVGRLILMHVPDPAAALRRLSSLVRPGGIIAFSENDINGTRSVPDMPLFRQVTAAITRCLRGDGAQCAVWHHTAHGLSRRRSGHATPDPQHANRYRRRQRTSWPTPRKSGAWCYQSHNSWAW